LRNREESTMLKAKVETLDFKSFVKGEIVKPKVKKAVFHSAVPVLPALALIKIPAATLPFLMGDLITAGIFTYAGLKYLNGSRNAMTKASIGYSFGYTLIRMI
jgi:hypothetical protein